MHWTRTSPNCASMRRSERSVKSMSRALPLLLSCELWWWWPEWQSVWLKTCEGAGADKWPLKRTDLLSWVAVAAASECSEYKTCKVLSFGMFFENSSNTAGASLWKQRIERFEANKPLRQVIKTNKKTKIVTPYPHTQFAIASRSATYSISAILPYAWWCHLKITRCVYVA